MIAFRHGVVLESAPSLAVETDGRRQVVDVPVPIGPVVAGDTVLIAVTDVDVGVERFAFTMALGAWPSDAPDPTGPLGLAATPVIVLPDPAWTELAVAGAVRAGRMEAACVRLPGDVEALGLRLLLAVTDGAEVVLVEGGGAAVLRVARALGGRPLPVLPLPDGDAVTALLGACELDVDVPVPSLEEPGRSLVSSLLRSTALVTPHRTVEVDPGPAFAEAGVDIDRASLEGLAAAAAGVLAGRLAAGNRRWRAEVEP